jgi:hypothetical protein
MYFLAKMAFLVWCMAPLDHNGSDIIYQYAILPFFLQNEQKIKKFNNNMAEFAKDAKKMASGAAEEQSGFFAGMKNKLT